jgi:hypothetical protein
VLVYGFQPVRPASQKDPETVSVRPLLKSVTKPIRNPREHITTVLFSPMETSFPRTLPISNMPASELQKVRLQVKGLFHQRSEVWICPAVYGLDLKIAALRALDSRSYK